MPLQVGARDVAFPVPEQLQLLDDGQREAPSSTWRPSSWASSRAPAGSPIRPCRERPDSPGGGRRLLYLEPPDRGRGNDPLSGHQPDRHHREDACPGHDHDEDADLHLDRRSASEHPSSSPIFPVLTATVLALLSLDRYVGTHFFTNDLRRQLDDVHEPHLDLGPSGGLRPRPAGLRQSIPRSCPHSPGKRLFGYTSMVYATVVIAFLSWLVWLHHFFTMGARAPT